MSYLRYSQDGQYIDIPSGSNYYIYDNGETIDGWSYEEFAALIGSVVDEIAIHQTHKTDIKAAFQQYFGGWDSDYRGSIAPPERAEIFCQCVDSRIDNLELSDNLHKAVQDWADEFDAFEECTYCGDEFRPLISGLEENPTCGKELCDMKKEAELYDVDLQIIQQEDRVFYELYENYGFEQGVASDLATEYLFTKSPNHEALGVDL
jgi:hypothetical protein